MTGTRRLLAIVTVRNGRTHILVNQRETYATLAMRRGRRETICGRKVEGRAGEHIAGEYGVAKDCKQCKLVAEGRGWI